MEPLLAPRPRPFHSAFARVLFLASVLLLAWTSYSALGAGHSMAERALPLLVPATLVLGTGGSVVGDRHPRLRWALLIGSGILGLIAIFVLRSRLLTK